jgi:serine/threonine-protein kinase HipA
MAETLFLSVLLHDQVVGTITYVGGERTLFSFNEAYVDDPQRPTLGLRFKDQFGQLITDFRPYRIKLMPFFSNLLPEGFLRTYLARQADVHPTREFFLLEALGRDLPGALTVIPAQEVPWPEKAREESSSDQAQIAKEAILRFSLAGVQLKFSAVKDSHGGLTIPAKGVGGDWIVKLPSSQFPLVPENEFSMMSLARKVGIDTPRIELIEVGAIANLPDGIEQFGPRAFLIERFDRSKDGAVHIEDFAQVFGVYPDDKYKKASFRSLLSVVASESDHHDVAEFIRRLTFNVLIGNGDMHLKNWSLIYRDRRRARLSPAYDFVSTLPYIPNDRSALRFSRTKDFAGYTFDELEHLAARTALPRKLVTETASETVHRFMELWRNEKESLPLEKRVVETIGKHLEKLPIVGKRSG